MAEDTQPDAAQGTEQVAEPTQKTTVEQMEADENSELEAGFSLADGSDESDKKDKDSDKDEAEDKDKESDSGKDADSDKGSRETSDKKDEEDKSDEEDVHDKAEKRAKELETSEVRDKFWGELMKINPDSAKIASSQEFKQWLKEQPSAVKSMAAQWDSVADAASVLSMFQKTGSGSKEKRESTSKDIKRAIDSGRFDGLKVKAADGSEMDFKRIRDELGDELPEFVAQAIDTAGYVKMSDIEKIIEERIGDIKAKTGEVTFWAEVHDEVPDAKRIMKSEGMKEYLAEKPVMKRLADSRDPSDIVILVTSYKDYAARKVKDSATEKAEEKMGKKKGLLKSSLKPGVQSQKSSGKEDTDDFAAGWSQGSKN